jgi:tetratricopeptide (TPR) repeat protein
VRACTGSYGEAWTGMQETLRWLESLKQVRYQLIAHDFIGHLLLDLGLNELAVEQMERGLALGRDTGMAFWRAAIEAHVAVARSRLGDKEAASPLQATLEQTRRTSERYLMVRCIDALAEIALEDGDTSRCRAYADELLAIAVTNGLRELEASARRWRGKAFLTQEACVEAEAEFSRALALAEEIGRVRLAMDAEAALARALDRLGRTDAATDHDIKARAIAEAIKESLPGSGLEMRLAVS